MGVDAESTELNLADLLRTYTWRRPPLAPADEKVYAEQYRLNGEGASSSRR